MFTAHNETCWTHEAIAEIEAAFDGDRHIGAALSDDDLSHVPTFGVVLDQVPVRAAA